ncbi:MAG: hypothetical protein K8U57_11380 [Planctomycetes bacterium]|nr:hypothetical protein [Planctomycetota bacterium]
MATTNITLSSNELTLLLNMLEAALDETRVELHHTHFSPAFRDNLKGEAELLRGLLERFRRAALEDSAR